MENQHLGESAEQTSPVHPVVEDSLVSEQPSDIIEQVANELAGVQPEPKPEAEEAQPEPEDGEQNKPEERPRMFKVGDDELTEQQLIEGYLRESDYTRKTQELAEKRKAIEPWAEHIKRIQTDPDYFNHVFRSAPKQEPEQPAVQEPQWSDDPVERLKQEVAFEAEQKFNARLNELRDEFSGTVGQLTVQQQIERIQTDPMNEQVMTELRGAIPKGSPMYQALDTNPDLFIATYSDMRNRVLRRPGSKPAPEQEEKPPVERSVKERAPVVESAAQTAPVGDSNAAKKEQIKRLRKRVKSGEASNEDIGNLLEAEGLIEFLV